MASRSATAGHPGHLGEKCTEASIIEMCDAEEMAWVPGCAALGSILR